MGRQSVRSFLAGNIVPFVFFGIYLVILGQFILNAWLIHQMAPSLTFRKLILASQLKWMAVILVLFGLQVFRLIRGLGRCGGTAVLVASSSGLQFRNAPSRPRDGSIARQDLRGLHIAIKVTDGFQRHYQLLALQRSGRQVLLIGRDRVRADAVSCSSHASDGNLSPD